MRNVDGTDLLLFFLLQLLLGGGQGLPLLRQGLEDPCIFPQGNLGYPKIYASIKLDAAHRFTGRDYELHLTNGRLDSFRMRTVVPNGLEENRVGT